MIYKKTIKQYCSFSSLIKIFLNNRYLYTCTRYILYVPVYIFRTCLHYVMRSFYIILEISMATNTSTIQNQPLSEGKLSKRALCRSW